MTIYKFDKNELLKLGLARPTVDALINSASVALLFGDAANISPNSFVLIGSGGKIESVVANDGELLIGRTGDEPIINTLTGTIDQINITNGQGSITIGTPLNLVVEPIGFSINGGELSKELLVQDDAVVSGSNTGDQTVVLSGDVSGTGTGAFTTTIANDAVTNAKLANMATQTFKGRNTAGTGDPEDLSIATVQSLLGVSGSNTGDQTITLTGPVTGTGTGTFATTISNDAVSNALLANMATQTIKGRSTAGTGDPEDLSIAQALAMLGLAYGTYTPTLTGVANVSASTAFACQYLRIGSVIGVSGRLSLTATATSTLTQLGISLPVASNLANFEECAGTAVSSNIANQCGAILADATNDRAELRLNASSTSAQGIYFLFIYQVI